MPRGLPRVIVNLKTYPEATGKRAVALAEAAVELSKKTRVPIALAVQAVDLRACVATGATVLAQHVDRVESSQSTGAARWESMADAGAAGTLINHSERRIPRQDIAWAVEAVSRAGGITIVCSKDADESAELAFYKPDLIAVEPPELIGGDVSVTTANPDVVQRTVTMVRAVNPRLAVLCGAGVKDDRDVAKALDLGAYGILVASGVTKAKRPAQALANLVDGVLASARAPRGRVVDNV